MQTPHVELEITPLFPHFLRVRVRLALKLKGNVGT